MQDTSCLVLPIPAHTFFKQTVLQGQIGHHLLQCGGLTTKILHLARGCSSRRITGQPTLAGLQEFLRPTVIHRGGNAFAAAQFGDVLLAAQSFQHDADFLLRRVLPTSLAPNVLQHLFCRRFARPGFLFPSSLLTATMNQKSSLREVPQFVSWVLKGNSLRHRRHVVELRLKAKKLGYRSGTLLEKRDSRWTPNEDDL